MNSPLYSLYWFNKVYSGTVCQYSHYVDILASITAGEKGKPEIKASVKTEPERDAKKMENGEKKEWKKGSKKEEIKIDRTEIVKLDKIELPNDLEFKGYEERIIQNITIWTDNVMYKPEKYYSALEGKTYLHSKTT